MDAIDALNEAVEAVHEDNNRLRQKCNDQSAEIKRLRTEIQDLRLAQALRKACNRGDEGVIE